MPSVDCLFVHICFYIFMSVSKSTVIPLMNPAVAYKRNAWIKMYITYAHTNVFLLIEMNL